MGWAQVPGQVVDIGAVGEKVALEGVLEKQVATDFSARRPMLWKVARTAIESAVCVGLCKY